MSKRAELEAKGYKTYENDEIEVFWNLTVCQHAGKCVQGNSGVFDPKRRPWIDLAQASAKEIASIIDRCPSKALQYELKQTVVVEFSQIEERSKAFVDGMRIGECHFSVAKDMWIITHTGVRPAYNGKGIAKMLVLKVIEEARKQNVKIRPVCPYAKRMMEENEEFCDVLEKK